MSNLFNEQAQASIALIDKRSANLERTVPQSDPLLNMIDKLASNPNLDADKIERLLNVFIDGQRKMAQMQDEREYFMRIAEFKEHPPEIVKRLTMKMKGIAKGSGKEYEMTTYYADLNEYADACMGALAEKGITWDFEGDNSPTECWARCVLHYGLFTYRGPRYISGPETSGLKNPLQAQGSAASFLMRYSFCAATGMTAALPPDKNGATTPAQAEKDARVPMEDGTAIDFIAAIEGAGDADELQRRYFEARDAAAKLCDVKAAEAFANAKNKRIGQLNRAKKATNA